MRLIFTEATLEESLSILEKEERVIFNFLNAYSIYLFKQEERFNKAVTGKKIFNFLDGGMPSFFLSLMKFKRISRLRGPDFIKYFLKSSFAKDKKILFVGNCSSEDCKKISKEFNLPLKNLFSYSKLPFIAPKIEFAKEDIENLMKEINYNKINYCFLCIGNPRQEILSFKLSEKLKKTSFLSVGAGLDFLLKKKKEAPLWIRKIWMEWFYRLLTDFHHSKKKVLRSFVGAWYLLSGKVKLEVRK